MTRRQRITIGIIALLVLLPVAVIYRVASTESGLQFVASRLGRMGTVTLTVQGVKGTLLHGFSVESLRIQHRYADTLIKGLRGRLEFMPLLYQRISVPDVSADSVAVISHKVEAGKNGGAKPHFLPRLLEVSIGNAHVQHVSITAPNGTEIIFTEGAGAATIHPLELRVHRAQLRYQDAFVSASGRVLAARPWGMEGNADVLWRMQGQPEWHATVRLDGDMDKLPLEVSIDRPFHATVRGAALTLNKGWTYSGAGDILDFDLEPFGGGKALGLVSGKLDIQVDQKGFAAQGALDPAGLAAGPFDVDFAGNYAHKKLQILHTQLHHRPSQTRMTFSGSVEIVDGGPALDLAGQWTAFRWPLPAAKPAFRSPRGSLRLHGIKPWQLELQGNVLADPLPLFQAKMQGALAGDSLQIQKADLALLNGTAELKGEVRWNPGETWQISGTARGIDPALLRPDLPGRLSFSFDAKGAPFGDRAALDFAFRDLAGQLRGQDAAGNGQVLRAAGSEDWQFEDVKLRFGKTRIELDGSLGDAPDLNFTVNADDLSLVDPEASGRINARGRLAGLRGQRTIKLKASGTDFSWHGTQLDALDADIDFNPGAEGQTQGRVDLSGLLFSGRRLERASVRIDGTNAAQRLGVNLVANPLRLALTAEGALHDDLWQGQFKTFNVDSDPGAGSAHRLQLSLDEPAPVQFSTGTVHTQGLCLKGTEARICLDADRAADTAWSAAVTATSLPLHVLTAGLSQDITYDGTLNVEGKAAGKKEQRNTGEFHAQLNDALLRQELANGREERMSLGSGRVDAIVTHDDFNAKLSLDAGASGNFRGELVGQRQGDDWSGYPIRGSLVATTDGLGLLDIFLGSVDRATGRISTDVKVDGTIGAPVIGGQLQLRDAQIDVYQINLALRDLSLDARFNAEDLEISGQSRLGEGMAKFNGSLAWRNREPFGGLHVEGERLRVVNVPEGRIEISPRLDFRLAGRRIDASGEVLVPYARLAPADLTNAVLASSDEALVGAPPVDPEQRWIVVSNVKLVLGDEVNLDAFGLAARLGGSITVRIDEGQAARGQGELNIVEGKFMALGRRLDIERGRLFFNNGPVNDPGIDLRAQKEFPDVTAGVNVRGTLRSQRMTFFSDPSIPQQQIASLILAGGTLAGVQSSDNPNAGRSALLAQGGAILAQQYGSKVGIEDVGIETDLSNETSLVFGRYLSDRLYISYGISLAEAINTLKLRYTIGDRWTLKTESGKAKSADLEYTIRK